MCLTANEYTEEECVCATEFVSGCWGGSEMERADARLDCVIYGQNRINFMEI